MPNYIKRDLYGGLPAISLEIDLSFFLKEKEINEQGWQTSEKDILPHHHAVAALLCHVNLHYTFYPPLGLPCLHLGDR